MESKGYSDATRKKVEDYLKRIYRYNKTLWLKKEDIRKLGTSSFRLNTATTNFIILALIKEDLVDVAKVGDNKEITCYRWKKK